MGYIQVTQIDKLWPIINFFPPQNHPMSDTAKNYKSLLKALQAHLVKDTNIYSSIAPKSYVKVINYMNI